MDNLISSLHAHVDAFDASTQSINHASLEDMPSALKPVRIAILDSGFDLQNPLIRTNGHQLDPRIKDARNFIQSAEPGNFQDNIGHGTHALGTLLKIATCAEIYIAKIADGEILGRESYDAITKARSLRVSLVRT